MNEWKRFDLNRTIHDYNFTMNALCSMKRFMDTPEFKAMDTEAIFRYIADEMSIVPFSDFLKRYIYEHIKIKTPFSEVPNAVYHEIIDNAFADNNAPFSLGGATTKKSQMINRWLTQKSVKREAVFTLGFGLKMKADDVSVFLTKVLGEEDFDFSDPQETIIWFCLKRGLPYSRYLELMENYQGQEEMQNQSQTWEQDQAQEQEKAQNPETATEEVDPKIWASMADSPELFLTTEKNLQTYLAMLRAKKPEETKQQKAYQEYLALYDKCREIIAELRNQDAKDKGSRHFISAADITPGDAEKELCSGIPYDKSGNLEPITCSCFSDLFRNKKMSRQRINTILDRERKVERFDLITLLFFIYAEEVEPDRPSERISKFITEINQILRRCGMAEIYPVIPYEAFVMMCLVTECPLEVYAEVWEQSYEQ